MREIKFRAVYKPDSETESGLLMFHQVIDEGDIEGCRFTYKNDTGSDISYPFPVPFLDNDWEVIQFTGLHDKNGKEIYEGDIVESDKNCLCNLGRHADDVVYRDGMFKIRSVALNVISSFNPVVIGNIHENPELLEG